MALIDPLVIPKLLEMKHVKPEEVSGLTYTTPDGRDKAIIMKKQPGKPTKTPIHKKEWWPEEKKIEVATLYIATGSYSRTAKLAKVPEQTVRRWKDSDWWMEVVSRIRREENEQTDRKFSSIVDKALTRIEERIDSGDYMYDIKRGIAVQVPVGARDLAIVTGTLFDKRQLLRGEATKISKVVNTEEHLNTLAEKFIAAVKQKGVGMKIQEIEEAVIIEGEVVAESS